MKILLRFLAIFPALAVVTPGVAEACAVCFSGRTDEQRIAFGITTAFMTFLPLLVIGTMVWWIRRRMREMAAEDLLPVTEATVPPVQAYRGTSIR